MTVNLLPPKIKQEKKIIRILRMSVVFFTSMLAILLIASVGLWGANYYVQEDIKKVNEKILEYNQTLLRYKDTESSIKQVNGKLAKIDKTDATKVIWSNIIFELAENTPINVQITSLSLNQESNKVMLAGYAETRNDIAIFKEKLEGSSYFKSVAFSSSIHNEQKGNFSFNISSEIEQIK